MTMEHVLVNVADLTYVQCLFKTLCSSDRALCYNYLPYTNLMHKIPLFT